MRVFFETLWIFWIILFKWIILILDYIVVGCIGLYCCGLFWVIFLWIITESISNGMKDNITHDGCCVFRGGTRKSHVAVVTLKCEAASCLCLFTVFAFMRSVVWPWKFPSIKQLSCSHTSFCETFLHSCKRFLGTTLDTVKTNAHIQCTCTALYRIKSANLWLAAFSVHGWFRFENHCP